MSYLCCEEGPVYTSVCAKSDVDITTVITTVGQVRTNTVTTEPFHIDLRHAPYKQMCVTVSAPLTLRNGDNATTATVVLQLYSGRSTSLANFVDSTELTTSLADGDGADIYAAVTPVLLHRVAPGEYTVVLSVSSSNTDTGNVIRASGRINVCATLNQLVL
jgi:hypothetical protein